MRAFGLQLVSADGVSLSFDGVISVVGAGTAVLASIKDASGAALNNGLAFTNGNVTFYTDDSVLEVDVYGQTEYGHAFQLKGLKMGYNTPVKIDLHKLDQVLIVPMSATDSTATVEEVTAHYLATKVALANLTGFGVDVIALDATETVDVGIYSGTGTVDPNGLVAAASVAAVGFVQDLDAALVSTAGVTAGHVAGTASGTTKEFISYTTSAGTDTFQGLARIPYHLPRVYEAE